MAFSLTAAQTRLMMPTSPGVEIVGARLNVHAPGHPSYQVLFVNPFQTSRVCASSLRRVSALRGTLNSRIPIPSLRPHLRSAPGCGLQSTPLRLRIPRRSSETSATTGLEALQARTTGRWTVTRSFPWGGAGTHVPVRRVSVAGGRMFEFLVQPR
jgi:hypothetical protein